MIPMPTEIWMQTLALLIAVLYLLRLSRVFRPSETPHASNSSRADPEHSVKLRQIYPEPGTELETDVDIIAIHGFDTKSPDTWIWKSEDGKTCVNWLSRPDMLPKEVEKARIYTCDWPSKLFEDSSYVQKTFDDFAKGLLASIEGRFFETKEPDYKQRPTVFIASCLGGVILIKALVLAGPDYFKRAVHGIVFLATPFSGTSFLDVAEWAEPGLRVWAWVRAEKISNLLYKTKLSANLIELRQDFHKVCSEHISSDRMVGFYETGTSSLPRKLFPWLPEFLAQEKVLVGRESASLDVFQKLNYHRLDCKHSLMNKFSGPKDPNYESVVRELRKILKKIRGGTTLYKADVWIKDKHYQAERLAIRRISDEPVSIEKCFINLVVVEHPAKTFREAEIDIRRIFDLGRGNKHPRRVLIRGHAGVGKSTLCKKIVHDFKKSGMWDGIFNRILWVPLRNLKRNDGIKQSLKSLLKQEFFLSSPEPKEYANQLCAELGADSSQKTLFILDGLDEVREGLEAGHYMFDLLQTLLKQPAVIVTCRPYVSLANRQGLKFDLELETIGFSHSQVELYVENVLSTSQNSPARTTSARQEIDAILALLQRHQLLQDLVRIPIQLDALCYIWTGSDDSLRSDIKFETMTSVYQAVVARLWRKDIPKLELEDGKPIIPKSDMDKATLEMIEEDVPGQLYLLQRLAFSGMVTDTISFENRDWQSIIKEVPSEVPLSSSITTRPLLLGQTLARLSFWRASDPASGNPSYHFIHLTFQEYFAARYFVRQWKKQEPLKLELNQGNESQSVEAFLENHKYDARYDIFWRFVAGLLSLEDTPSVEDNEVCKLFSLIGKEPLDILGSVHERLIMHCLSEVPPDLPRCCSKRADLEKKLVHWLSLEYKLTLESVNIRVMELPEACLESILETSNIKRRIEILESLRRVMPPRIIRLLCSWIEAGTTRGLKVVILEKLQQQQDPLVEETSAAVAALLEDKHEYIQQKALAVAEQRSIRGNQVWDKLMALAENLKSPLRLAALRILIKLHQLDDETIESLKAELKIYQDLFNFDNDQKASRRHEIVDSLAYWATECPDISVFAADISVEKDKYARLAAIEKLQYLPDLGHDILDALRARAEDQNEDRTFRIQATRMILYQQRIDNSIHNMIRVWLQEDDLELRYEFLDSLKNWPQPEKRIVDMVVEQLQANDEETQEKSLLVLGNWHQLDDGILYTIAESLKKPHKGVRLAAATALRSRSQLKDCVIEMMMNELKESHEEDIQILLLQPLIKWVHLRDDIRKAVLALLKPEAINSTPVMYALYYLGRHPRPPDAILRAFVNIMNGVAPFYQGTILRILGGSSFLNDELLRAIAPFLKDRMYDAEEAFTIFAKQSVLPFMILEPYMEQMFKISLHGSFKDHIYWLFDEKPCLVIGTRRVYWANTANDEPGLCSDNIDLIRQRALEWKNSGRG